MDKKNNPDIEEENHNLPVGVGIKDLRKVFKVSAGAVMHRQTSVFFLRSKRKGDIIQ